MQSDELLKAGNAGLSTLNSHVRLVDLAQPAATSILSFKPWQRSLALAKRLLGFHTNFGRIFERPKFRPSFDA